MSLHPIPSAAPRPESPEGSCLNCGAPVLGPFCQECGQRHQARLLPLRTLLREALEDFFSVDNRVVRTLGPLVLRPGFLTREYLAGRRARYVPPFRLYLILSVLHFLVLTRFETDWFFFTSIRSRTDDPALARRVMDALPQVMFVLMPALAALLTAAYRGRRLFVEHLIFALHFHAFAYLVLTVHAPLDEPLRRLLSGEAALDVGGALIYAVAGVVELSVPVYFVLAVRRVYRQGWLPTLLKAGAVYTVYVFVVLDAAAWGLVWTIGR